MSGIMLALLSVRERYQG